MEVGQTWEQVLASARRLCHFLLCGALAGTNDTAGFRSTIVSYSPPPLRWPALLEPSLGNMKAFNNVYYEVLINDNKRQ